MINFYLIRFFSDFHTLFYLCKAFFSEVYIVSDLFISNFYYFSVVIMSNIKCSLGQIEKKTLPILVVERVM